MSSPFSATTTRTGSAIVSRSIATVPSSATTAPLPETSTETELWAARSAVFQTVEMASVRMSSLATAATRFPVAAATGPAMNTSSSGSASAIESSSAASSTTASPIRMERASATASSCANGLSVETKVSVSSRVVFAQPTLTAREMRTMARMARTQPENRRKPDPDLVGALPASWDRSSSFSA